MMGQFKETVSCAVEDNVASIDVEELGKWLDELVIDRE